MKKINVALLCSLLMMSLLSACSKNEEVKENDVVVEDKKEVIVEEKVPEIDPEIEKLNKVLMSMTPRCKEAIPNGDPKEFLADLKVVLDAE